MSKWVDLVDNSADLVIQRIKLMAQIDKHNPEIKKCATFNTLKEKYPVEHKEIYLAIIQKYLTKKKISLKVKIGDKKYEFPIETCMKSKPELKKLYNQEVSLWFRQDEKGKPLGFMKSLDSNINSNYFREFKVDLKASTKPEEQTTEVVTPPPVLPRLEMSSKYIAKEYAKIENDTDSGLDKEQKLMAKNAIKECSMKLLEIQGSKISWNKIRQMK